MTNNRPRGRQKNVTGQGKSINRRGAGLGTGPVGKERGVGRVGGGASSAGGSGRTGGAANAGRSGGASPRGANNVGGAGRAGRAHRSGGVTRSGSGFSKIIILLLVLMLGGGGGIGSMLLGGSGEESSGSLLDSLGSSVVQEMQESSAGSGSAGSGSAASSSGSAGSSSAGSIGSSAMSGSLATLLGSLGGSSVSSGWDSASNTGTLDTSVAEGAREKYTKLAGSGADEVTIMVYLCGTDLESRSKMATSDLQEMLNADLSENVSLIVYTGGCRQWQNSAVSSQTNQIWQVKDEGMVCLEENLGSKSMTDPDTLTSFIQWCGRNFPANRNGLIFWDHGGGSVSGYGYDEKFASSGSMSLAKIDQALEAAGMKFDFVGFDACLMATAENALMLAKHADYMIASEELEPGIGWYYTDWLTQLSENTSLSTVEIGRIIVDDFVETCAAKCPGQSTTLSVVDLAEAQSTIPAALAAFSKDTCALIENQEYAQVSNARNGAREFGSSSKIDQVDLAHLARNMGTEEGAALAEAICGSVKYNRTSSNMTNAYGLSIYFPFRKASMVDDAVGTYEQIGMDEEYVRCIQAFASMEVSGQAVSGGTSTPLPSLMDMLGGSSAYGNADMVAQLLGSFLSGEVGSIAGLASDNTDFLSGRAHSETEMAEYIAGNLFDSSQLRWTDSENGPVIALAEEQWALVQNLHANLFFDDGEGYIDLGTDTVFDFDENGNLLAPEEMTWIAVNEQPVAYYHEATVEDGDHYSITGRIPILYNGERAELVVEFTDAAPEGQIVGVRRVYHDGETATLAKTMDTVVPGDVIDFVCDYYSYEGEYLDSYLLGEQLIVEEELYVSDVYVEEEAAELTYLFTDIYNQQYWSEPVAH